MTEPLRLTPTESVTIRRSAAERLEVEASYAAGSAPPPSHLHPAQAERFEVLEGTLHARVDGEEHVVSAGDVLEIPAGSPHQMWNPGAEAVRASWETRPRGRTEQWFHELDRLQREGRVGRDGMPGPLAFGVLLTEYRDVFRLAARPRVLVSAVLRGLALLGRARGYEVSGTSSSATPVDAPA